MDSNTKKCLVKPTMEEAFDCLKIALKTDNSPCHPRLVLLTQENCDSCKKIKTEFKDDIKSDTITVVDIDSDDGKNIITKNDVDAVPNIFLLDCNNFIIEMSD